MVFPICTFEEADSGFKGQCHKFVHSGIVNPRILVIAVLTCESKVLEDFVHDKLAAVATLVEIVNVTRVDRCVIPWNCTESLDLAPVFPGSPESCSSLIMPQGSLGNALDFTEVSKEIVDVIDGIPVAGTPAALKVRIP